ncbi:MAG: RHS repeat-associated core domain-containing protein [Chloroflexota bacterium]|nr:RHS repeat-associated core domain-containing protein [Chloroflexota bacterium]
MQAAPALRLCYSAIKYPPRPCTVRLNRIPGSALDFFSASYRWVGYTHRLGIDQPLSVIRIGYGGRGSWNDPFVVVPHANWRALFDVGSFETGAYERCRTYRVDAEPDLECIEIDWPAPNVAVYLRPTGGSQIRPSSWMGSLLDLQRDASGQLYRRNRYYDPFQGRFTQEDPIGLAGGINLYGFADGDPVSYSDPYGLCVPWPQCALAMGTAGSRIGTVVGGGAGAIFGLGGGAVPGAAIGNRAGWLLGIGVGTASALWIALNSDSERSIDDPGSLEGATPDEVKETIPEGWVESPSKKGGGTRYTDPRTKGGDQVRVMPGNPGDPNPVKQGPYVRVTRGGTPSDPIPLKGNPTLQ